MAQNKNRIKAASITIPQLEDETSREQFPIVAPNISLIVPEKVQYRFSIKAGLPVQLCTEPNKYSRAGGIHLLPSDRAKAEKGLLRVFTMGTHFQVRNYLSW